MTDILAIITAWLNATQLPMQLREVDVRGLFSNGYFLVPFLGLVGYFIYKQAVGYLVVLGLAIGLWVFSGSQYLQEISSGGEIQLSKILPLLLGGIAVVSILIYLFFRDN